MERTGRRRSVELGKGKNKKKRNFMNNAAKHYCDVRGNEEELQGSACSKQIKCPLIGEWGRFLRAGKLQGGGDNVREG